MPWRRDPVRNTLDLPRARALGLGIPSLVDLLHRRLERTTSVGGRGGGRAERGSSAVTGCKAHTDKQRG
jgi:hypothetical protein